MDTASAILSTSGEAFKTLSQLNQLTSHSANAAEQLHTLRDVVERVFELFQSLEHHTQTVRVGSDSSDLLLGQEVDIARKCLQNLQALLLKLPPDNGKGPAMGVALSSGDKFKRVWILLRDNISRVQRDLQLSYDHILARLTILNV